MKKILIVIVATVIGLVFAAGDSYAQKGPGTMWRGSGGWGQGSQYNRMYDPKAVETVSGEVTDVNRITPAKGMSGGLHMNVKTDKEFAAFLEQDIKRWADVIKTANVKAE